MASKIGKVTKARIAWKVLETLLGKREEAELAAWKSLGGYKFNMFGYWVGKWVGYNQCLEDTPYHQGNPFKELVHTARHVLEDLA